MGNIENFKTEQETFWAGNFGTEYITRNEGSRLLASNLNFFSKAIHNAKGIKSCLEFGANIGMNLKALRLLFPDIDLFGIEINNDAADRLSDLIGKENVFYGSIFDFNATKKVDLVLIKGVMIHINPDMLNSVYEKLYESTNSYILLSEYYNPSPVAIPYRGHSDKLFKRDFAGELLEKYSDLELVDYGFAYKRDPMFPQDDVTWFLLRKVK
jgi:pseudaminic acid biosynthesis-associated methylase